MLLNADGVWWQSIVAAGDAALLTGIALAVLFGPASATPRLQMFEGAFYLCANVFYFWRDGMLRLGNGSGSAWPIACLIVLSLAVRLLSWRLVPQRTGSTQDQVL